MQPDGSSSFDAAVVDVACSESVGSDTDGSDGNELQAPVERDTKSSISDNMLAEVGSRCVLSATTSFSAEVWFAVMLGTFVDFMPTASPDAMLDEKGRGICMTSCLLLPALCIHSWFDSKPAVSITEAMLDEEGIGDICKKTCIFFFNSSIYNAVHGRSPRLEYKRVD